MFIVCPSAVVQTIIFCVGKKLVDSTGFEPATSTMSTWRSKPTELRVQKKNAKLMKIPNITKESVGFLYF